MRLSIAASALVATATCAAAFRDASPALMFSDSILPQTTATLPLQSSSTLLASLKAHLSTCPSEIYYIFTQPLLLSTELSAHAPHIKNAVAHPSVKGRLVVNEVVDLKEQHGEELREFLERECGAQVVAFADVRNGMKGVEGKSAVVRETWEALEGSKEERRRMLKDLDSKLYQTLHTLSNGPKYTVILLSTPATNSAPEPTPKKKNAHEHWSMDPFMQPFLDAFQDPLHMDLKRDNYPRGRNESEIVDYRPLFEKYNFLSPGLFMGLLVTILLLAILSVGISAISSLEVSYGAFDKEMGPAAQQKNKQ